MVDFIDTRVACRDRVAALALADSGTVRGAGRIRPSTAHAGKRTLLGMAISPIGPS